jgi:hypothetical protein
MRSLAWLTIGLMLLMWPGCARAEEEPPPIPVGLDAYRQWDQWYVPRIGARAYMRSTYDRSGGNEAADASHFLYQEAPDRIVTLDVEGPGVLYFVRTNHWHGSPWHYSIDGRDYQISESSTADPNHPVPNSTFLVAPPRDLASGPAGPSGALLLPPPLAWTWATTKGADLNGVPMPFEQSLRLAYARTHYGTGYYIYHQFVPGARLSRPLKAWDGRTPPDPDVLDLIGRAGTDLVPQPETPEGRRLGITALAGRVDLPAAGSVVLARIAGAPTVLRALTLSVPREQALSFGRARLRITWDDRDQPSVDAPVALFFGAGTLYNRDNREYLVKAFPVWIHYTASRVDLACFFPMPFLHTARIELVGAGTAVTDVRWALRQQPLPLPPRGFGYFHATYRDHPAPEPGKDLVLLDTCGVEGNSEWSGQLVGTSFIFSHRANLGTLEGDPRFFFDDSRTPQIQGTGTEEWCGGGDYWGGQNMTLPFFGHPTGAPSPMAAKNDEDRIESAYRFLLADLMPFGRNARICLEHGGTDESTEHYETVTDWYGAPSPTLVMTDSFHVGDGEDEALHRYVSPQGSPVYSFASRYEWGVDTLNGSEIYPAQTDFGRVTTGESSFTLRLRPDNWGVLLRRKLDYLYPNQRAQVYVADAADEEPRWQPAGVWYLAGSNTCLYSNPPDELGAARPVVETSNRRFRDDEFLLPRALTRGRAAIRVRLVFTPVQRPLFPGAPLPPLAWSEMRYTAYCFVQR